MQKINRWLSVLSILLVIIAPGCSNNDDPYDPDYIVSAPVELTASSTYPDYIELSWKIPNGGDLYSNIYREPGITQNEKELIGDIDSNSYRDNSVLAADVQYKYSIEPVSYSYKPGQTSTITGSIAVDRRDAVYNCSILEEITQYPLFNYKWYSFSLNQTKDSTITWNNLNAGNLDVAVYDNNMQLLYNNISISGSYVINNVVAKYPSCYVRISINNAGMSTIKYSLLVNTPA